ncbi:protein transport protein SEC31-like [Etheostoma cragini]|uniref:protein transport protein SEC31-like n=1 Tax=Etheostoma cragini TaxID=417921 RepID=UPI00155E887B|nr:protein transport protein SEC31-like [Etheostoma cragini]
MSFASDKLYKGYLRRKMPTIVTTVKTTQIMIHLPCLTSHDRENIEAKRETRGDTESMVLLLDCLKRRENWPEQFIEALEACEHPTLAAEIRAEYNTLRGINNFNPNSPPLFRAHVHPAPSASHRSLPQGGANSQAVVAPPAEASAPPQPAAQASPPLETPVQQQVPQSSAANVPEAVSPSEPVAKPPQVTQNEVMPCPTPPLSPVTPHDQATKTPPPQRKIESHQEPVENSESDIQDISGDTAVIPDQVRAGTSEVSLNSVATLQPPHPVEQCETDSPTHPDPVQTTTTATEISPPQSPSPTQMNSDVTNGSSFPIMTPERPPVQDTTPPVDLKPAAVLQPEQMSGPPATQVVESSPQTETAAPTSPLPGAAGVDTSLCEDTVSLSKPGQLISILPPHHEHPAIPAPSSPVQPYSGNTERLEMSDAAGDTVTSACLSARSAVSSTIESTVSRLPCQENGIALNHNEPEENHYDSPSQSFGMQEVLENVVHVSEEASILNQDGQSPTPQAQIVSDEAATPAPPLFTNTVETVSSVNTPSSENYHPSEPAPADISPQQKTQTQDLEKKVASGTMPSNTKYILTAAGVGACALLMAWRFRR